MLGVGRSIRSTGARLLLPGRYMHKRCSLRHELFSSFFLGRMSDSLFVLVFHLGSHMAVYCCSSDAWATSSAVALCSSSAPAGSPSGTHPPFPQALSLTDTPSLQQEHRDRLRAQRHRLHHLRRAAGARRRREHARGDQTAHDALRAGATAQPGVRRAWRGAAHRVHPRARPRRDPHPEPRDLARDLLLPGRPRRALHGPRLARAWRGEGGEEVHEGPRLGRRAAEYGGRGASDV